MIVLNERHSKRLMSTPITTKTIARISHWISELRQVVLVVRTYSFISRFSCRHDLAGQLNERHLKRLMNEYVHYYQDDLPEFAYPMRDACDRLGSTDVLVHQPFQMPFIQHDHLVEQIVTATADPALGDAVLPRTAEADPAWAGRQSSSLLSMTSSLKLAPRSKIR